MKLIRIRYAGGYNNNNPFDRKNDSIYYVDDEDVDNMIIAVLQRYGSGGINPHNGTLCDNIILLAVEEFQKTGLFLWTTLQPHISDLQKDNPHKKSVAIYQPQNEKMIFMSKEVHSNYGFDDIGGGAELYIDNKYKKYVKQ